MDKKQVLIASLLIIAVVLSLTSIIINASMSDFESIQSQEMPEVDNNGNVNIVIENTNTTPDTGGMT